MAFKRLFDRVVLKVCKLAFDGIYSDSEADEFKERFDEDPQQEKVNPAAERLAARALCKTAVKAYCQKACADEEEAWKIISDTIGKPSKDFTTADWKKAEQLAKAW